MSADPIAIQRAYYAATAAAYDGRHVAENDEHGFTLAYMLAVVDHFWATNSPRIWKRHGSSIAQDEK